MNLKIFVLMSTAMFGGFLSTPARAQVTFFCSAVAKSTECAFTVFDEKGGALIFLLAAQQSHAFGDELTGQKYCMQVVPVERPNRALDPNKIPTCWKETVVKAGSQNQ